MRTQEELTEWTEVIRRLDVIICLLLDRRDPDSGTTATAKIVKLGELGASPAQVAEILGKPLNYVTAAVAMRKKAKGRA